MPMQLIAAKRAQSNRWAWAALTGMGQIANAKTKVKRQFRRADTDQDGMLNIVSEIASSSCLFFIFYF